jgi:uncharacterized protein (TIGR03435 family)
VCAALLSCIVAGAQSFDVASVRRAGPESKRRSCDGGPGTADPGQIVCGSLRFRELVLWAYNVDYVQIDGPSWITSNADLYDVRAKVPAGSSSAQVQKMAQNLLIERFHLAVHHETRAFLVWELAIAKGGLRMKESTEQFFNKPDYPAVGVNRVAFSRIKGTEYRIAMHGADMKDLVSTLRSFARRMVVDKTGLTGRYDAWLEFDGRTMMDPGYSSDLAALNVAIEQQLGLRFVDAKAPFDVVIVDHAEKEPAEN